MVETVILDLDDTLYDEIDYCKSGFAAVADHLATLPQVPASDHIFDTFWRQFSAGNRTKTFNAALDELAIDYDDRLIRDFLPAQKLKARTLKIEEYFKTILYTEELGRECWKPSPAGFEKILQTLNAAPQSATYVADNQLKDFIAPNTLGMTTIQLIRPNRIHTQTTTPTTPTQNPNTKSAKSPTSPLSSNGSESCETSHVPNYDDSTNNPQTQP